jgi:hypothetical protein
VDHAAGVRALPERRDLPGSFCAPPGAAGSWPEPKLAQARILGIQRKLHKSSIDDQDRRFKDLHNLVCDPATLMVASLRVRANRGSRSAGVDGQTARHIEQVLGVQKFLDGLREELRSGTFRPLPVRERYIPIPRETLRAALDRRSDVSRDKPPAWNATDARWRS